MIMSLGNMSANCYSGPCKAWLFSLLVIEESDIHEEKVFKD